MLNIFKKDKKGMTLVMLIEIILMVSFAIFIMFGAEKIISHEAKYRELDVNNLGLFLERAPSIPYNFYYKINFKNNYSLEINEKKVLLDKPDMINKRYIYDLSDLGTYSVDIKFKNIKNIHIYKIGNDMHIKKSYDNNLADRIIKEKTEKKPQKINFYYEGTSSLRTSINSHDKFKLKSQENALEDKKIPIIIIEEKKGKPDIGIFYNPASKETAKILYNAALETIYEEYKNIFEKEDKYYPSFQDKIKYYPIKDYKFIKDNDIERKGDLLKTPIIHLEIYDNNKKQKYMDEIIKALR
ncbi:MAG: hypothetical protein ACQER9_00085 [Nanobdellota archaeon]